jgi:hypothetical protein
MATLVLADWCPQPAILAARFHDLRHTAASL